MNRFYKVGNFLSLPMYVRHNFKNSYIITGPSVKHHVWCLSPVVFKTSTVETQDSASKYEEGCELDKHSSCLNHMSMPKDNRNRNAPHSWCSSQKFSSIYPTASYNWRTEKKVSHVYQSFIHKVHKRIQVILNKKISIC